MTVVEVAEMKGSLLRAAVSCFWLGSPFRLLSPKFPLLMLSGLSIPPPSAQTALTWNEGVRRMKGSVWERLTLVTSLQYLQVCRSAPGTIPGRLEKLVSVSLLWLLGEECTRSACSNLNISSPA